MTFPNWFVPKVLSDNNAPVTFDYPTSKVICVGRNYADHAKELNNPVPKTPILFLKPNSSLVSFSEPLRLPSLSYDCHFETELALLIGPQAKNRSSIDLTCIGGVGVALDLTLRQLQLELKEQGKPWEKAKGFNGACPITDFLSVNGLEDTFKTTFKLVLNGEVVQLGETENMIFSFKRLLDEIQQYFNLLPGDIILTGTPAGVGQLNSGDELMVSLEKYQWHTRVE